MEESLQWQHCYHLWLQESGHTSSSPSACFLLEGLDQKPKGSSSSGALNLLKLLKTVPV